ncbi:MAG: 50S ribosomal protein L22 [Acidimicrobiia bacterium]
MPDAETLPTETRQTVARLRHLRTSPTKVRPVLALIAGQDVFTARDTLRLSDRAVSHDIGKVLDSAVANAEHNDNIPEDELYIANAYADEGPTNKRWRPRARGRGTRIRKRTTHLTIVVARFGDEQLELRRKAEAASPRGPRRPTRRRAPRATEQEHDHDHEHDDDVADDADEATPAEKATKKSAKKSTKKAAKTTKKAAKTAEKSTKTAKKAKKTSATKTGAEKSTKKTTAKKTPTKKSPTTDPGDASDEDA